MEPKINYNQTIKKVINKKGTLKSSVVDFAAFL